MRWVVVVVVLFTLLSLSYCFATFHTIIQAIYDSSLKSSPTILLSLFFPPPFFYFQRNCQAKSRSGSASTSLSRMTPQKYCPQTRTFRVPPSSRGNHPKLGLSYKKLQKYEITFYNIKTKSLKPSHSSWYIIIFSSVPEWGLLFECFLPLGRFFSFFLLFLLFLCHKNYIIIIIITQTFLMQLNYRCF